MQVVWLTRQVPSFLGSLKPLHTLIKTIIHDLSNVFFDLQIFYYNIDWTYHKPFFSLLSQKLYNFKH